MKNINLKSVKLYSFLYVLAFMLISGTMFAQSTYNLNGTFEGVRKQFDNQRVSFAKEFQYKYDLKQTGDVVEGVSTIYSTNGDYAEVAIKGMVVGDLFYFQEYRILDEMKATNSTWCYKTGVLELKETDGIVSMSGRTRSFMSNYGTECTGGETSLFKTTKDEPVSKPHIEEMTLSNLSVYPNPAATMTKIQFDLKYTSKIEAVMYDLNGTVVRKVHRGKVEAGTLVETIDVSDLAPGMYIMKVNIGEEVYSEQIIKTDK